MIFRTPDYWKRFRCWAGDCPRSCCTGWEVVVDKETADYYRGLPGAFGDRLRAALMTQDGEVCFARTERHCPLWNADGLCEVYLQLGEEHTSQVCRTHPRFYEDFGGLREGNLSASCPETAHLLLESQEPLTFPAEGEATEPWLDPWTPLLAAFQDSCLAVLSDRSRPWRQRAAWLLLMGNNAQALLDDDSAEELEELCLSPADLPADLPEDLRPRGRGLFPGGLELLEDLTILESDWGELLEAGKRGDGARLPDWAMERISCYFLFRYLLRAVRDGDLLSRVELAVFSTLTVERLAPFAASAEEALYRYCREIEHCQENLEAVQNAFCTDGRMGLESFFEELARGTR